MRKIAKLFIISFFSMTGVKADVAIDPVQMYILNDTKQKTTTLTLESINEAEKKIFEIKAFKWDQNNKGEDVLEKDNTLIINPRNFILKPNGKQVIRVGFNRPIASVLDGREEGAWRIIIEELPQPVKESSITFLMNFNLPLFIGKQDNLKLNFNIENDKLVVKNKAKSHVQISKLQILDSNKKEVFTSNNMKYALEDKNIFYELGGVKINNPQNYFVKLMTDKSNDEVELKLMD
ncbi:MULTISPECIES: fimbrial biogenesis chaperone [Acinetobacter]|uniref:fimbrial biogenesis chaperone n=1 Tax=Acinetobacter TaxID=469 RepID=UPI0015D2CB28|nr:MULTISPECIES: fimbria/pilus periplasmic chaperone [Acinetobacter]MDM1324960.1 molecular chaperone [Acinetobacter pseudolwoffii]